MIPYKSIDNFIETRNIDITIKPYISSIITFSNNCDFENNYGYKNMKFLGAIEDIFEIKLILDDTIFDVLYPGNNPDHKTLNILDDNIIPCIKDVNYSLVISSAKETNIKCVYDIYNINNITNELNIKYIRNEHRGGEICRSEENNYSLYKLLYTNIITELTIYSNNILSDIYLYTNNNRFNKPFISESFDNLVKPNEYSIKYKYVCRLDTHIDFAKVVNPHIKYCFIPNTIIYVFGKSLRVANSRALWY